MVVGLDFCFSFPAWFVRDELECADGPAFWELMACGLRTMARSGESRPALLGEASQACGVLRRRAAPDAAGDRHRLQAGGADSRGRARGAGEGDWAEERIPDRRGGRVGTASLRGMPVLRRLREAGFAVWPFDRPALKDERPMVVEMYTRLNTGPVCKSNAEARTEYLRSKCREDAAYSALSRGVIAKARGSEDAFDALVSCMAMVARRGEFASLAMPLDPEYKVEGWTWAPGVGDIFRLKTAK